MRTERRQSSFVPHAVRIALRGQAASSVKSRALCSAQPPGGSNAGEPTKLAALHRTLRSCVTAVLLSAYVHLSGPALTYAANVLIFDHDQSLPGANFAGRQDLAGAIFTKANCTGADFSHTNLVGAQLDDANFQGVNLDGARAANTLATKVRFQRASLRDVDFTGANLLSALFDGAVIDGADFTDAMLDRATVLKLCSRATGINSVTGVSTAESLMCEPQ